MYHFQKWLGFPIFCDFDTCHKEITIDSLIGSPCILNDEQVSALFTAVHWKKNKLGEDTSLMSFLHCALFEQCTGKKERSWMRKLFLRLPFLRAHFSRAFATLL